MGTIKEKLKLMANSMKSRTLMELLENDTEYQRVNEEACEAVKACEKLELSKEQRDVVGRLIARRDEAETDRVANAYLAGILDGYEIMKTLGMVEE